MSFKTPRLVRIGPDYPASASKRARHERQRAYRDGAGLAYREIGFDRDLLQRFMALWERQTIRTEGKVEHPSFRHYPVEKFEREGWTLFGCDIGIQPVLICDRYANAGPPLYDKEAHPWLAKFLWFRLIDALEGRVDWLDLGGGSQRTWRQLLEEPDASYKNLYVQPYLRKSPAIAPPWRTQVCRCGWRQLVVREEACRRCAPR